MNKIILIVLASIAFLDAGTISDEKAILTGKRSKSSVMFKFKQNIASLNEVYRKRLKSDPELFGTITIKFSIDASGTVITTSAEKNTVKDQILEDSIVHKISTWKFEPISDPMDTTVVIYPFVFSKGQSELQIQAKDYADSKVGTRTTKNIAKRMQFVKEDINSCYCAKYKKSSSNKVHLKISVNSKGFASVKQVYNDSKVDPNFLSEIKEIVKSKNFGKSFSSKKNTEFAFSMFFNRENCKSGSKYSSKKKELSKIDKSGIFFTHKGATMTKYSQLEPIIALANDEKANSMIRNAKGLHSISRIFSISGFISFAYSTLVLLKPENSEDYKPLRYIGLGVTAGGVILAIPAIAQRNEAVRRYNKFVDKQEGLSFYYNHETQGFGLSLMNVEF